MAKDTKETQQNTGKQGASDDVAARRRRLLTAGASSPLLMTIASRPAWAQGGQCTASALASANASGGYDFDGCSISAGWWGNFKERWPVDHTTSFHSIFGAVKYEGQILYNGFTLGQVIDLGGGSDPVQGTFGKHLIAALMNAKTFPPNPPTPGYAFSEQQIISAFNSLDGAGKNEFKAFATTLEDANNQFDATTDKPEIW